MTPHYDEAVERWSGSRELQVESLPPHSLSALPVVLHIIQNEGADTCGSHVSEESLVVTQENSLWIKLPPSAANVGGNAEHNSLAQYFLWKLSGLTRG